MAWRRRGLPACPGTWCIARPPGPGSCWEAAGKSLASKPSMAARYPWEALEGAPASSTGLRTPPAGTGQAPGCCCSFCTHVGNATILPARFTQSLTLWGGTSCPPHCHVLAPIQCYLYSKAEPKTRCHKLFAGLALDCDSSCGEPAPRVPSHHLGLILWGPDAPHRLILWGDARGQAVPSGPVNPSFLSGATTAADPLFASPHIPPGGSNKCLQDGTTEPSASTRAFPPPQPCWRAPIL